MTDTDANTALRRQVEAVASPLAPAWLNDALNALAERVRRVPPLPDNRESLPEFIYRH